LAVIILCSFIVVFQLFNTFMSAMYNCLVADVVPRELMGRFLALFRAVGTAAGFIFARYVFGKFGDTHRQEIFLYVGLIYLAAFMLMCWRVREGTYPPVVEPVRRTGPVQSVVLYFRECFTIPLYLNFFLMNMFMTMTTCMMSFYIFFFKDTLGMSMAQIGNLIGWIYLVTAICSIPMGFICDKVHAVRLVPLAIFFTCLGHLACWLFVYDVWTLYLVGLLSVPAGAAWGVSSITSGVMLLPKEKYGQFISAMGMLGAIGTIAGNLIAGAVFDSMGSYRLIYAWYTGFEALALVSAVLVYYGWKKHGGKQGYVPLSLEPKNEELLK
jgi:MFS family permease